MDPGRGREQSTDSSSRRSSVILQRTSYHCVRGTSESRSALWDLTDLSLRNSGRIAWEGSQTFGITGSSPPRLAPLPPIRGRPGRRGEPGAETSPAPKPAASRSQPHARTSGVPKPARRQDRPRPGTGRVPKPAASRSQLRPEGSCVPKAAGPRSQPGPFGYVLARAPIRFCPHAAVAAVRSNPFPR